MEKKKEIMNFFIYKMIFTDKNKKMTNKELIDIFSEKIFSEKITYLEYDKNFHKCYTHTNKDEKIILMRIENNCTKEVINDLKTEEHEHHPVVYAILYINEKDSFLAIERSSAIKKDKAVDIIKNGLNIRLAYTDVKIDFEQTLYFNNFINQVDYIIEDNNDVLKSIKISTSNKNNPKSSKKSIEDSESINELMDNISPDEYTSSSTHEILMSTDIEKRDYIINLTTSIVKNNMSNCSMTANFKNYGSLEYDDKCHIAYNIHSNSIDLFTQKNELHKDETTTEPQNETEQKAVQNIPSQTIINFEEFTLKTRLDEIKKKIKGLEKNTIPPKFN